MDPLTIAAGLVALFIPMLTKAGEEFGGKVGTAVYEKTGQLLARLKRRWAGDTFAEQTIARFEADPHRYGDYLQDLLVERIEDDRELREELARSLGEIQEIGPELKVVQRARDVVRLTGLRAREISGGTVNVTQEVAKGEDVTGVEIGMIGPSDKCDLNGR